MIIENFNPVPLCPIKRRPFKVIVKLHKVFVNLHKCSLLIVNIVKSAVLGLRQFLATESP